MSNPASDILVEMPSKYSEAIPILNDNFDKVVRDVSDLQPRTFATAGVGARPAAGKILAVVSTFLDRPEYDTFATLTPQYDVYVDSGTNATGTLSIDNTFGAFDYTVSIGDYFCLDSELVYPNPAKPRIYVATSSTTVVVGATGSCSVVAERCGSDYNVSAQVAADQAGVLFSDYFGGAEYGNTQAVLIRPVAITPDFGGGGGGGALLSLTTTGGSGSETDSTKLWPNGSGLTSAQKSIVVEHQLNKTTSIPNYNITSTYPYTKNFATATIRVVNHDSAVHSIYVYLTGTIFSGINANRR